MSIYIIDQNNLNSSKVPLIYEPSYDKNIPLTKIKINGDILDNMGKISIKQSYKNNYNKAIEAIYHFNLTPDSVLISMNIQIGSKNLQSVIKEKTMAKFEYSEGISSGCTSCLLELNQDNSYKISLGNILPNETIVVEIVYLTVLTYDGQVVKFVLPTNIAEKYNSTNNTKSNLLGYLLSYGNTAYDFEFEMKYKSSSLIKQIKSLTNEIEVQSNGLTECLIKSNTKSSNGDFNLFIQTDTVPSAYHAIIDDETYIMINHKIPDEIDDIQTVEKEYIFVLDRSGSMNSPMSNWSGATQSKRKIDLAKESIIIFMNSLPPKSKFNIYSFGSNFKSLYKKSNYLTNDTKKEALKEIESFESDMGGTEILNCLEQILSGSTDQEHSKSVQTKINLTKRVWNMSTSSTEVDQTINSQPKETFALNEKIIILLTDGQVNNPNAIISLAESYNHLARIFTIGIGSDVDRNLISGISSATNAYSECLIDNCDISVTVAKILGNSLKTYYKDISLSIEQSETQKPKLELDTDYNQILYPGQILTIIKKIETHIILSDLKIQINGTNGKTKKLSNWNLVLSYDNSAPEYIKQLYAWNQIKYLTETNKKNSNAEKIIQLSLNNSICTNLTSFVVVDEEVRTKLDKPLQINVKQHAAIFSSNCDELQQQSGTFIRKVAGYSSGRNMKADSKYIPKSSFNSYPIDLSDCETMSGLNNNTPTLNTLHRKSSNKSYPSNDYNSLLPNSKSNSFFTNIVNSIGFNSIKQPGQPSQPTKPSQPGQLGQLGQVGSTKSAKLNQSIKFDESEFIPSPSILEQSYYSTEQVIDWLIKNLRNVDGSFEFSQTGLDYMRISQTEFYKNCLSLDPKYEFNLLVLKYLRSSNNQKYEITILLLESWLNRSKSFTPKVVT